MKLQYEIIRTAVDHETVLSRINEIMDGDPEPSSDEGQELERLCSLVSDYEAVHYPMDVGLLSPVNNSCK